MDFTPQQIAMLHELGTTIAATAAVIAALSSLKNGRTLNGKSDPGGRARKPKASKSISPNGDSKGKGKLQQDWYNPPVL